MRRAVRLHCIRAVEANVPQGLRAFQGQQARLSTGPATGLRDGFAAPGGRARPLERHEKDSSTASVPKANELDDWNRTVSVTEMLAPEDERVLDRVRVIAPPDPAD